MGPNPIVYIFGQIVPAFLIGSQGGKLALVAFVELTRRGWRDWTAAILAALVFVAHLLLGANLYPLITGFIALVTGS